MPPNINYSTPTERKKLLDIRKICVLINFIVFIAIPVSLCILLFKGIKNVNRFFDDLPYMNMTNTNTTYKEYNTEKIIDISVYVYIKYRFIR